jgi:glycosyltransferase involved in cell wall biosynthesis
MRVLLYAPAARMGGARTHVLGLAPAWAAAYPDDEVLLVAQPDLLRHLPPLPRSWTLQAERAERRGLAGRLATEQVLLPRWARRFRADVLLSFGSFAPLVSPCRVVLHASNALPFSRVYWDLLRRRSSAAYTAELARWTLLSASFRASARLLTPTRALRQEVLSAFPNMVRQIDVAPLGVSGAFHDACWCPPEQPTLVALSRHAVSKEFDILVAAVPYLTDRWPELRVLLTGTPDETVWARRTADLVANLRLQRNVSFLGEVPHGQVPGLIAGASAVVFPTWCESFGLPLVEALAVGAPAVAGDIPACREVGADAARYYHPGDVHGLADTLANLLLDRDAARELAQRAKARGQTFGWAENATATHASLERAVTRA